MPEFNTLLSGYSFFECPRWHDGRLWLSDFYPHQVIACDLQGRVEKIADVPGQPSGLGWLPDGRLLIEVEDQGGGLPEAQRRRLEGMDAPGPGLGLTVVMRELARLDGEIGVHAEPGRATRITLRLPACREVAP